MGSAVSTVKKVHLIFFFYLRFSLQLSFPNPHSGHLNDFVSHLFWSLVDAGNRPFQNKCTQQTLLSTSRSPSYHPVTLVLWHTASLCFLWEVTAQVWNIDSIKGSVQQQQKQKKKYVWKNACVVQRLRDYLYVGAYSPVICDKGRGDLSKAAQSSRWQVAKFLQKKGNFYNINKLQQTTLWIPKNMLSSNI